MYLQFRNTELIQLVDSIDCFVLFCILLKWVNSEFYPDPRLVGDYTTRHSAL